MSKPMRLVGAPVFEQVVRKIKERLEVGKRAGALGVSDSAEEGGGAFGAAPVLTILANAQDPVINIYIRQKQKLGAKLNIGVQIIDISQASPNSVVETIHQLNQNPAVGGIVVQLPLPGHLLDHRFAIFSAISPKKDVDVLNPHNYGALFQKTPTIVPPTPKAAIDIAKYYSIPINGASVVIVGDGILVGRPLYALLKQEFSPNLVTIVDKSCQNLAQVIKQHSIVFLATGSAHFFTANYFREDQIVFDLGASVIKENGRYRLVGDLAPDAYSKLKAYTPTPGGVGPVTVANLFKNLVELSLF